MTLQALNCSVPKSTQKKHRPSHAARMVCARCLGQKLVVERRSRKYPCWRVFQVICSAHDLLTSCWSLKVSKVGVHSTELAKIVCWVATEKSHHASQNTKQKDRPLSRCRRTRLTGKRERWQWQVQTWTFESTHQLHLVWSDLCRPCQETTPQQICEGDKQQTNTKFKFPYKLRVRDWKSKKERRQTPRAGCKYIHE